MVSTTQPVRLIVRKGRVIEFARRMSWIIGYVGQGLSRPRRERLAALGANPIVQRSGRTFFVAAGGLPETCMGGDLSENEGHWCVVGTGVRLDTGECRLLSASDWRRRLGSQRPRLDRLGGGFVALRFRTRHVEAFSDVLGLRSLYWLRVDSGFIFSSRPDWLASVEGGLRVDWKRAGSHWLSYNQLSHRCLVRGVERLGPGGYVVLTEESARAEHRPYAPRTGGHHEAVSSLLAAQLRASDDRTISLGLSGGMDSRTLLALRPRDARFSAHVFGPKSREDVRVALTMAEDERLAFSHFHVPPTSRDDLLHIVSEHAVQAQAVSPASASLSLRYYPELRSQQKLVVDGGFGEILRRQFMNRLIRRGGSALRDRDASTALEYIRFERASIFNESLRDELEAGALDDMSELLNEMAEWLDLGLEDAVDLINIRTRLPNFFGYEQARLDELVQNFMPFSHPRLIDSVFNIPSRRRRRSRISRKIIAANGPRLRRYPLVKSDVSYSYGLPSLASALYVKLTKRYGQAVEPADRTLVLHHLKDYLMDRIESSDVRNDDVYDGRILKEMASGYYRDGTHGAELDWWLSLDLWRNAIEHPTDTGA